MLRPKVAAETSYPTTGLYTLRKPTGIRSSGDENYDLNDYDILVN